MKLDDREFLNDPSRWPIRAGGMSACAIKRVTRRPTQGLLDLSGFATLMHSELHGYVKLDIPFPEFMAGFKPGVAQEPTTVDKLLEDGWVVD